ncbi:MAG: selenocysteine-specific translation elongation factor [Proteobacteria bacterium]|nr:selenocysteine-specific translation elongation factor [Pseudomonadota bacterium]
MIVATAGHIDNGKTALVKALTGTDTDRLPEEKARGLSIDLGFAYRPLAGGAVLGVVDVPGHERFVRNMIAGVTGIDFALLVVAADDGPMPQTAEHLAILDLLGIAEGAVALTKIDRVEAGRVAEVGKEVEALLSATTLAGVPIFPVSSPTGEGIAALARHLEGAAARQRSRAHAGHFRLAVDRGFTLAGAGLVVTGTVFSGAVRVGESLVLSPEGVRVRVRGLHVQNRTAEEAGAGDRAALNIAAPGLSKERVARGDWLVAEPAHAPVSRLDARLRLLRGEARPLAHWSPVHVHLGTADVSGRVAILEARSLAPGADGLVQVVLDRPIGALTGDRFILRDQSARRTLAGGRVLDPFPPARGRARPERLAQLAALERADPAAALAELLAAQPAGVDLAAFARARNLTAEEAPPLWRKVAMVRAGRPGAEIALSPERFTALKARTLEALGRWHASAPERIGPGEDALRAALAAERVPRPLFAAVVHALVAEGKVVSSGMFLSIAGHEPVMAPADRRLWERVRPVLEEGRLRPPVLHEIAASLALDAEALRRFLNRAAALGQVVRVVANRFLLPDAVAELALLAEALAGESADGLITAAAFRDRSGIGRNLTIQVLEFFDSCGFTRRVGDARRLLRPAGDVFGRATA